MAIKNKQYTSWLGLTWQADNKYYPESKETLKGHGQKTKNGLRSMKMTRESDDNNNNENVNAMHLPRPTIKQKEAIIKIHDLSNEAKCLMYTDQTGKFPKKLSCGYQCIMVLIEIDSNVILMEAMKNRSTGEMIQAYQVLVERLCSAGLIPTMHILDNKCSAELKERIKLNNMKYQLVPPHDHRQNIAEKAIQVFKAHFISILCSADTSFPFHLWDRLLGQAEHTLNMLWTSRMTPLVSAYAYLWGKHDYNVNPFAPLGCKVEAHVTPNKRETWAPYTASGFYVGNAWEHYRCYEIYICDTKHTRTCLTAFFNHKYLTMPTITPADALIRAADYLTDAILGLVLTPTGTQDAVDQLMVIFKQQARATRDATTAQKVLRECAQAERVTEEEQQMHVQQESVQEQVIPSPSFEIEDNNETADTPHSIPQITQYKHDSPPSANTRQQRETRTLTQDFMLQCMEIPGYKAPLTAK
jgi:hypothetical protein